MRVRSVFEQSAVLTAEDNNFCSEADQFERAEIVSRISGSYQAGSSLPDFEMLSLDLQPGSSMHYVQKPFSDLLAKCVNRYEPGAIAILKGDGLLMADGLEQVAARIKSAPEAHDDFEVLKDGLNLTGGQIWSNGKASYAQWLRFHGLHVPTDIDQLTKLVEFLTLRWSAADQLPDYWECINGGVITLTAEECKEIRDLTTEFFSGSLLDILYEQVKPKLADRISWESASDVVAQLIGHQYSQAQAKRYIERLAWWGANSDEALDSQRRSSVLYTAIILQLDPLIGTQHRRNCIAGFDIYDPETAADQSLSVVRENIESHLVDSKKISRLLVPLASHLLLSSIAPTLLVKNIPAWLTAGSISWVVFSQTVSSIEMTAKGASRLMTYDQVMKFADLESISKSISALQGLALIDAATDWGLINEVITPEDIQTAIGQATQRAMNAYQNHVETIVKGTKAFTAPVPNRRRIALAALEPALPNCDFLEEPILRPNTFSDLRHSILELQIEDELASGQWDWNKQPHILTQYPLLQYCTPTRVAFLAETREYHKNIHAAMETNIKMALAGMPRQDRDVFERSRITFFTVRRTAGTFIHEPVDHRQTSADRQETKVVEIQADKDRARGRFALIMIASHGNNELLCYEMFSLLGECRRNDALGALIKNTGKMSMPSRLDYKGGLNDKHPPVPETHNVPIDISSYMNGTQANPNSAGSMIIEKLGTIAAPVIESGSKKSYYQYFISAQAQNIAKFIVANRPIGSVDELLETFTDLTEKEKKARQYDEAVTFVIDLIVPFKKCIEDLASGERNKVVDGIYGCSMDAIGVLFTLVGAPVKVLNIATKSISQTAKLAKFLKYGLQLAVSTFNPIDGLPSTGYKISKILIRNGLSLAPKGLRLLDAASSQLKNFTGGRHSTDLIQAASLPALGQGKWRPRGGALTALSVSAFKKSNHWYALTRSGKPWGKKLPNFEFKCSFTLPSARPESLTKHIIEHGLRISKQKLDSAITVLTNSRINLDTDLAIGLFLGTTDNGRAKIEALLKTVRLDFAGVSASNFFLDPLKTDDQVVSVDVNQYNEWKKAELHARNEVQFMTVNNQNLNMGFEFSRFNYGAVADDLLHEMCRAQAGTVDYAYAPAAIRNKTQHCDVSRLLNFAAGHIPYIGPAAGDGSALQNADSIAMLVALLSQKESDPSEFNMNMTRLKAAVKRSAGRKITEEVWLNLND
ncbi:hypothetical protein [Pseudomonas moraviensis]